MRIKRKHFKFLIKSLFLLFIGSKLFITYALSNTWDLNVDTEYTVSDTNNVIVSGGLGQLKMQLNHEGSIVDGAGGALLNQAQDLQVVGNYAYISATTSDAFEIVDISNPANPIHVGSLPDGGAVLLNAPKDLVVDGNYAYITVRRDDAIEIVDISNPANPTHVTNITKSATIQLDGAKGIEKVGNLLYVVSNVDDALEIIDVTDPANPTHVGALADGTRLNGAEDIIINGNYAYISAETNDSIEIVDISNPANPVFVGELTDGTNGATLNGVSGLALSGNYLYAASSVADAFEVVDISDPTNPTHIASVPDGIALLNGAENIQIDGNYAFITAAVGDALEVINISNPVNPVHETSISNGTALLNGAKGIQKIGNYIYIASDVSDALEIVKITYSNTSPYIVPNNALVYSGSVDKLTDILGAGNEGSVSYQISKDNGATWYYLNGTTRTTTTAGVSESNTTIEINSEIQSFNGLAGGTGEFIWKAFLTSNGNQKVELDSVDIAYTTAGINEIIDFETPGGYTVTQGTWTRQTVEQYEGLYAIEADNGGVDNTTSCFEVVRDIYSDSTINFQRKVSSEANYDFLRFYIDGTKMDEWSGTVARGTGTYNIGNGNHTFSWCYEKDGSVSNGDDTARIDYIEIKELPAPPVEITVLDFEVAGGYTVTTSVTAEDWFRQQLIVYEGSYALQSADIVDNQEVCFERIQDVSSIDTGITFYKKVSSESGWDFLRFSIDGTEQDRWSGEIDWSKETYTLSAGTYTLQWCYTKDGSVSNGDDTARIDIVTLTQDPPIITEVTPVPTPTNDTTPDYTFNTPIAGSISYSGSCTSSTNTGAVIGDNTITFDTLVDGIYTDCTIQVLASPQNTTILNVSNFTVDTTGINITFNYPTDGSSIPSADFDIDISYSDDNGVNTGSIVLQLFEWNGSSYGPDIAPDFIDFTGATITETGAIYPTLALTGSTQYKIEFSIDDTTGNNSIATSVFDVLSGDTTPPNIINNFPTNGILYPNSNFNINISYSDTESSINTGSIVMTLKKWDGLIWGSDISGTYITGSTITSTSAIYNTSKLGFGKYQIYFYIEDSVGNGASTTTEFYIDEPELIINTGSLDIGTLKDGVTNFSTGEFIITVKTVGAGFDLILNKDTQFLNGIVEISDWDGYEGVGYDKSPYTNTINLVNSNEIIATETGTINIDGNKNSYLYNIKFGALIGEQQVAGNYSANISFSLDLNY